MTFRNKVGMLVRESHRLTSSIMIVAFLFSFIPRSGLCSKISHANVSVQATKFIALIRGWNPQEVVLQCQGFQSFIQTSPRHFAESKKFLKSFIHELNISYGELHNWESLTLARACKLIRSNFHSLKLSADMQEQLLKAIELFDPESHTNRIALDLSEGCAQHIHFYWPWEWNYFGLNKKKHSPHNHGSKHSKSPELELPGHMATGFALSLAGALICLLPIPGAQLIGAEMIFAGGVLALEGFASGEKPYYIDSQTGKPIDDDYYFPNNSINN